MRLSEEEENEGGRGGGGGRERWLLTLQLSRGCGKNEGAMVTQQFFVSETN